MDEDGPLGIKIWLRPVGLDKIGRGELLKIVCASGSFFWGQKKIILPYIRLEGTCCFKLWLVHSEFRVM